MALYAGIFPAELTALRSAGLLFGLALIAGCVAGVSPAVESMRLQLIDALKPQGQGDGRPASTTLRGVLVADLIGSAARLRFSTIVESTPGDRRCCQA